MTPRLLTRSLRRSATGYSGSPVIQSLRMRCSRSRSSSSTIGGGPAVARRPRVTCLARIAVLPPPNGTSGVAADERAHLGAQVSRVERLADEVRAADLHGRDAVAHVGAAGDEEDGYFARLRLAAQDLAELPAVEAGHADVEQYEGRRR